MASLPDTERPFAGRTTGSGGLVSGMLELSPWGSVFKPLTKSSVETLNGALPIGLFSVVRDDFLLSMPLLKIKPPLSGKSDCPWLDKSVKTLLPDGLESALLRGGLESAERALRSV